MSEEVESVKNDLIDAQRELVRAYLQKVIDYSEEIDGQDQLSKVISKLEKFVNELPISKVNTREYKKEPLNSEQKYAPK